MSIEQNICDAVDIIVNRAISQAGFDRTISAIVVECVDQVVGKYKVKYQDSVYYATSDNSTTVYNVNSEVYVLIPSGDFSKEKKILGTVKSLGANYITSVEGDEGYEYIGTNVVSPHDEIGLCSYRKESSANTQLDYQVLYDADSATSLLDIDITATEEYLKQSTHLIAGARFKTKLDKVQRNYGDYGLIFSLEFLDDAYKQSIIKDYVVNVDNMLGQPYNFTTFSHQIEEFEINGANFQRIKSIIAYAKDFPNIDDSKPNDIFIKDIEISGAIQIDAAALDSYYLSLMTPQGTFFPKGANLDALTLEAEIKIKGKVINNESHNNAFYWFVEHAGVDSSHVDYCKYGGQGWKCLNDYNIISAVMDDDGNVVSSERVEWVAGEDNFTIYKKDILAYQTKFKCVCIYNDSITLEKEIIIKNNEADYKIEITSSNGTDFSYDQGSTTLTCVVDNLQNLEYNYYWSKKNNVGTYEAIPETEEENERYSQATALKTYLSDGFKNETFFKTQMAAIPDTYSLIKEYIESELGIEYTYDEAYNSVGNYLSSKTITRLEKNVFHNLLVKTITNFSTYSCSVFQVNPDGSETQVGNASIKIVNSFDKEQGYSLVIHNGTQVFKYNESGLSPAHESNENPIEIPTLTFTLFDENGNAVEEEAVRRSCKVKWIIPTKETMLSSNIQGGVVGTDSTTYSDTLIFDYGIYPTYGVNKNRNNIDLEVTYKNKTIKARTNFTFLKDGDSGTNGTDYICKIVPNIKSGDIIPLLPMLTLQGSNMKMNYNIAKGNAWGTDASQYTNWFKVQLWNLGELVYEGISGDDTYQVEWGILKNKYGNNITETSFIDVTAGGIFSKGSDYSSSISPANIVKVTVTYEEKKYSATMPLIVAVVPSSDYQISLKEGTGFTSVLYSSDGTKPKYDGTNPFELEVLYKPSGSNWIDISTSTKYKPQYTWDIKGTVYNRNPDNPAWIAANLLKKYGIQLPINQQKLSPTSKYDGQCINAGLEALVAIGDKTLKIHIPIHCLLNRYGFSALNDWDGNSIELNKDEGMLLSPQVGAGKKNNDNTFTGVLMGTVDDPADTDGKHKTGLIGYASGQRSIFLDAETGKAEFGVNGKSKIILDPTEDIARIYSGNFVYKTDGTGTGLEIDLTTPQIRFGSGNFEVSKEGHLTAKGGGSIAGWIIGTDKLYKSKTGMASSGGYAFWAGNATPSSAKFSVTHDGYILAQRGKIGGFNIDDKDFWTGTQTESNTTVPSNGWARLASASYPAKICNTSKDNWRFNIGADFGVTNAGAMYCNNGYIGGWNINSSGLTANSGKTKLNNNGSISVADGEFYVDTSGNTTIKGSLTTSGNASIGGTLSVSNCTSMTVSGSLKVTGSLNVSGTGKIGGCSINSSGLYGSGWSLTSDKVSVNKLYCSSLDVDGASVSAKTVNIKDYYFRPGQANGSYKYVSEISVETNALGVVTAVTPTYKYHTFVGYTRYSGKLMTATFTSDESSD